MKTSELTGAALDLAVAKCEGMPVDKARFLEVFKHQNQVGQGYCFSRDWAQGGPIIERECIELVTVGNDWRAMINTEDGWLRYYGPTPLVAAMRCYVASQLGDEVEVPFDVALDSLIYETGDNE